MSPTIQVDAYIGLLVQIPLVGIFVWFSLKLVDTFLRSIDQRDQQWKEFIRQEREANNIAVAHMAQRFADEIRALSKEVATLNGLHKQQ